MRAREIQMMLERAVNTTENHRDQYTVRINEHVVEVEDERSESQHSRLKIIFHIFSKNFSLGSFLTSSMHFSALWVLCLKILFQIKDRVAVENAIDALEKAEIDLKTLIQLRIGQLVNNVRRKLKKDDSDCERLKKSRFSNLTLSLFSKKANAQPRPEVAESDDGSGRRN